MLRLTHAVDTIYGNEYWFVRASGLLFRLAPTPASMGAPPLMPKSCVVLVIHGGKADDLDACACADAHPRVHALVENGCCGTLLLAAGGGTPTGGWHRLVCQFLGEPGDSPQDAATIPTRWVQHGDPPPSVGGVR